MHDKPIKRFWKQIAIAVFMISTFQLLQSCSSTPVGYETKMSKSEQNLIHQETPKPEISDDHEFISNTEKTIIKLPPETLLGWLIKVPLESVLPGTADIASVSHSDLLTKSWGSPGSRRRVVLTDGNTALEELIEYQKDRKFKYVVWNFTNEARFATDYAIGEFTVEEKDGGSSLNWTYKFKKKGCLTGLLLEDFVKNKYKKFMQASIKKIEELSLIENS